MFLKYKTISKLAVVAALALSFQSCSNKDKPQVLPASSQYFTIVSESNGAEYLATAASVLTGSLSFVGNGLETSAARYVYHKEYIYLMNTLQKKFIQYKMGADGTIKETASILTSGVTPNYFDIINLVDDNTFLVVGTENNHLGNAGWARIKLPEFTIIDKGTFKLPYDVNLNVASDIGRGYVENGKFISGSNRYRIDDSKPAGEDITGSYALVYDYPSFTNMRLIKSTKTSSMVGFTHTSTYFKDEEGNHYFAASAGAAGKSWFNYGAGDKSGVLRIKKGTAEFDPNYFVDVTTPAGKNAALMSLTYVGNGIAFGAIQYEDLMTDWKDGYKQVGQIVKINIKTGEVLTMNSPLSGVAQVRCPLAFNNKYYTTLNTDKEAYIYEFDPAGNSTSFKKGLKLDGNDVWANLIAPHPTK